MWELIFPVSVVENLMFLFPPILRLNQNQTYFFNVWSHPNMCSSLALILFPAYPLGPCCVFNERIENREQMVKDILGQMKTFNGHDTVIIIMYPASNIGHS